MSNSYFLSISLHPLPFLIQETVHLLNILSLRDLKEIFRFGLLMKADKIEGKTEVNNFRRYLWLEQVLVSRFFM
jgi:hypothetical protein